MGERLKLYGASALAFTLAACSMDVAPSQIPTERALRSYNFRVAFQEYGSDKILVCYSDDFPLREDMEWTLYIEEGYCPSLGGAVKDKKLGDIHPGTRNNFQILDQKAFLEEGLEIPPVVFE